MVKIFPLLLFSLGYAEAKVCLNMVVYNQGENISRCLSSVKPFIDYWVIVDAGSTDRTRKWVQEILKDIPGELHLRSWNDPKVLLNEALELAKEKGDYLLVIQPNEQLRHAPEFNLPSLEKDCYFIKVAEAGVDFQRLFLISTQGNWSWKSSLYPTLVSDVDGTFDRILDAEIISAKTEAQRAQEALEGNFEESVKHSLTPPAWRYRSPQSYAAETQFLKEAVENNPMDAGLVFRLAESYAAEKQYSQAIECYQRRIAMGGSPHEIFWALYQIGNLSQCLKADLQQVVENYYRAYQYNPNRVEPLYRLAKLYSDSQKYWAAYTIAKQALAIPYPRELRFVLEQWIYDYGLLLVLSESAYFIGNNEEARDLCKKILLKEGLPLKVKESVEKNLKLLGQN